MNEIANQLVQVLFKKNSLQECSRWELELLADKYPYFGVAQLLVSGKLKEENQREYEKQVQKTSLYFTNPLWLDYILNSKNNTGNLTEHEPEKSFNLPEIKKEEINFSAIEAEAKETLTENSFPIAIQIEDEPVIESNIEEQITETVHIAKSSEKGSFSTSEPEIKETLTENSFPIAIQIEDEPVIESNIEEQITETVPETKEEIIIPPLKTKPLDENATFAFEPYHTVDYFASQGIKLSLDEIPKDKFGQQLKSFTQWLKTIKKLPPTEIAKEAGKGTEQKVITLAEHSIEDRDVVTETMADVWIKQGKKENAIEVYRKLSLQNPSKSSYFAGLIELLKQK